MLSNDVVQWCCPQEFMGIFTDGNCFYFTLLHFTPLYSTQTTPNGTQLKRGAGGSLLKPMFKSKGTIVLPLKQRKTKTTSKTTTQHHQNHPLPATYHRLLRMLVLENLICHGRNLQTMVAMLSSDIVSLLISMHLLYIVYH